MKANILVFTCILWTAALTAQAQGTLLYDQQSSTDENYAIGVGGVIVQFYGTVGQSFVPSFSAVDFVRLRAFDLSPDNNLGAMAVVNLRSTAINGPILATTPVLSMTNGFAGSINFFFSEAVSVTPGNTYFFEFAITSGDNWGLTTLTDSYASGAFYGGQFPFSGADLWFREGIVVPEPTTGVLLVGGAFMFLTMRARKRL